MYTQDMTLEEARGYEELLVKRLRYTAPGSRQHEQAQFDYEDVCERIQELDPLEGTQ